MNKRLLICLAVAVLISSCGSPATAAPTPLPQPTITPTIQPTDVPVPTVTPGCISPQATESDVNRALSYTKKVFEGNGWERTYNVVESRVSVTWLNNPLGAVVYLEAMVFPCGYDEPDLNKYYSDKNWATIFQNYESYEMVDQCNNDEGLRLYEFKTQNQGFEYLISYWVQSDTDTRVISTMIVFPVESQTLMDEYSSMLFPEYSSCSQ